MLVGEVGYWWVQFGYQVELVIWYEQCIDVGEVVLWIVYVFEYFGVGDEVVVGIEL